MRDWGERVRGRIGHEALLSVQVGAEGFDAPPARRDPIDVRALSAVGLEAGASSHQPALLLANKITHWILSVLTLRANPRAANR